MRKRYASLEEAFLSQIVKTDSCWLWSGTKAGKGYGQVAAAGERMYAHRFAWERASGPIPDGIEVLHQCDNPPCVRRSHLFLGTQLDNARDMVTKGRAATGAKNGAAKLDAARVVKIRTEFVEKETPINRLAGSAGVTPVAVRKLLLGITWSALPGVLSDGRLREITSRTRLAR
jgi:hypothetical protein